jgi:DNA-binding transcriptional LysR family regulator
VVIANPAHPLAQLEQVSVTQLQEERFVMREAGSGTRAAIERLFAEHSVNYILGCELSSNEAIKQAVQAGLGLAVVSLQTIELELETRRLAVLPADGFPILRHWYILHRRDKRLSAASHAFRDLLLSQVTLQPPSVPPTPAAGVVRKLAIPHKRAGNGRSTRR